MRLSGLESSMCNSCLCVACVLGCLSIILNNYNNIVGETSAILWPCSQAPPLAITLGRGKHEKPNYRSQNGLNFQIIWNLLILAGRWHSVTESCPFPQCWRSFAAHGSKSKSGSFGQMGRHRAAHSDESSVQSYCWNPVEKSEEQPIALQAEPSWRNALQHWHEPYENYTWANIRCK